MKRACPAAPRLSVCAALFLVLLVPGCKGKPRATVTGKVVYGRQLVTQGTVSFYSEQGVVRSCLIGADGTYRLADVPAGPARVVVVSHPAVPFALQSPGRFPPPAPANPANTALTVDLSRNGIVLPLRYSQPESSGLSVLLQRGEQTYDIELTP